jgi:flagellar hook-length control protein FliK
MPIDADSLQKQVVNLNSGMLKLSQTELPKPVYSQVYDELSKNLSPSNLFGKEEFNIKLNPESLGEIAVKIVKDAGKMLVTLTAGSETTAKILNSQLNQLQNQLRAYGAEVATVTVQNQTVLKSENASNQAYQQQYDEAAQQFDKDSQQPHKGHQGEHGHRQNRQFYEETGTDEPEKIVTIADFAEQFNRAV